MISTIQLNSAQNRMADYYKSLVKENQHMGASKFSKLDADRSQIMAILDQLAKQNEWQRVRYFAEILIDYDGYLHTRGHWAEYRYACEQGVNAATRLEDRQCTGEFLNSLGFICQNSGQIKRSVDYYQQALIIFQEIGNRNREGAALGNLGSTYYSLGELEKAIDLTKQAIAIFTEAEDKLNEGKYLSNLGLMYYNDPRFLDNKNGCAKLANEL